MLTRKEKENALKTADRAHFYQRYFFVFNFNFFYYKNLIKNFYFIKHTFANKQTNKQGKNKEESFIIF